MKRSKFSDTQIVSILKQAEAGMPVKEIFKLNQNHISDNLNIHEMHYLNRMCTVSSSRTNEGVYLVVRSCLFF